MILHSIVSYFISPFYNVEFVYKQSINIGMISRQNKNTTNLNLILWEFLFTKLFTSFKAIVINQVMFST